MGTNRSHCGRLARVVGIAAAALLAGAPSAQGAPGDLDLGFSGDGVRILERDYQVGSPQVVLQEDGRIVVAGSTYRAKGSTGDFLVARFLTDGTLDDSFSGNGIAIIDFFGEDSTFHQIGHDHPVNVGIGPGGRIVVTGVTGLRGPTGRPGGASRRIGVVALKRNGGLLRSYAGDGRAVLRGQAIRQVDDAIVYPDGRVLAAATKSERALLVRFRADGDLDSSFGQDGMRFVPSASAVGLTADEDVVLVGSIAGASCREGLLVMRIRPFGPVDPDFGNDGSRSLCFGSRTLVGDIGVSPSGSIVVAGTSHRIIDDNLVRNYVFARLQEDGDLDPGFSGDGRARVHFADGQGWLRAIALDGERVYGVGGTEPPTQCGCRDWAVAALDGEGALEDDFGDGGEALIPMGGGDQNYATSVAVTDGSLTLAGTQEFGDEFLGLAVARVEALPD